MARTSTVVTHAACIVAVVVTAASVAASGDSNRVRAREAEPWVPVSAIVDISGSTVPPSPDETLRVAAVQMANFNDGRLRSAADEITNKADKVVKYIAQSAALGADIAVFPEMVLVR
jgi:hypothetical protein